MAVRINKDDFEEKVLKSDLPVIVDFYSDSCIACKKLAPALGDVEDDYEGKLYVYKVNTNFDKELAKEYHVTTVLKPSACSYLPDELYSHIDLLVPNLDELNEICPGSQSMEEKADILLTKGIKTVIVTLGADGCYIRNADTACYLPAIDVVSTDSSGAGDAFICTLVSYLLYDYDLISASKIASYAAGLSTTRQGTTTALVDKYTLESYIRKSEPDLLK